VKNNLSVLNVYKKRTKKSKVVTQLLYGETFRKLEKFGAWSKIKNDYDNYKGYIKNKKFPQNIKNTHKVSVLCATLYSKPYNKNKSKKKLSFSSKIKIDGKQGNFYKVDKFWIKKSDVKKINHKNNNLFFNINKFTNIRYKWGGKHYSGIDCSGLIQLFLNYNNKFCPRDTKDQIKHFKKKNTFKKCKKK